MAAERQLVLDANILIRAVLGRRVRQIITDHAEHASFASSSIWRRVHMAEPEAWTY